MSLFRPTALNYMRNLGVAVALCVGLLAFWSTSAMAAKKPVVGEAPASVSSELAVCPGQTFAQSFSALGDSNYYTLVEGSEYDGGGQGWELKDGAAIVEGTRPDGSSGSVLDLPSGAIAVSPPVCVTLQYPTARAWVQTIQGKGGVSVGVFYAATKPTGQVVGQLSSNPGSWQLSDPFQVKPELVGKVEGVREVRFIYANTNKSSDFHLSGLFVDPRMR